MPPGHVGSAALKAPDGLRTDEAMAAGGTLLDLLGDGTLGLRVEPGLEDAAARWVWPMHLLRPAANGAPATIEVTRGGAVALAPAGTPPTLEARHVHGWVDAAAGTLVLAGDAGVSGAVDLNRASAELRVSPSEAPATAVEMALAGALWISAALLLGRQGRLLLHAGGVIAPQGGAWLLPADTHSGKTSTCASLIRAGWDYLSDDQVVITPGAAGEFTISAWPRRFHLDQGFSSGTPSGHRAPVDAAGLGGGQWRGTAPLAGLLLPRLEPALPTEAVRAHPAEVVGRLVRHAPWLLADAVTGRPLLDLMSAVARRGAYHLRLGLDAYGRPDRLLEALRGVVD